MDLRLRLDGLCLLVRQGFGKRSIASL